MTHDAAHALLLFPVLPKPKRTTFRSHASRAHQDIKTQKGCCRLSNCDCDHGRGAVRRGRGFALRGSQSNIALPNPPENTGADQSPVVFPSTRVERRASSMGTAPHPHLTWRDTPGRAGCWGRLLAACCRDIWHLRQRPLVCAASDHRSTSVTKPTSLPAPARHATTQHNTRHLLPPAAARSGARRRAAATTQATQAAKWPIFRRPVSQSRT